MSLQGRKVIESLAEGWDTFFTPNHPMMKRKCKMSDTTVAPTPAIPSRAAPDIPPAATPAPVPVEAPPAAPAAKKKAAGRKKKAALSAKEIAALNAKRNKAQKAKRKPRTAAVPKAAPAPAAVKSLNRPLEMKNRLQAVIAMSGALKKNELAVFSATLQAMENLSRGSRKRVIGALAQVYP